MTKHIAKLDAHPAAQTANPPGVPGASPVTFGALRAAVEAAPDLTRGTRLNLLRAVDIVARKMGAAGLAGVVDIGAIQRRFEKVTPAMIGHATAGGLSSVMSSFRRALRLAGVKVMPGKSHAPLSPLWASLREAAEPTGTWPGISRFAHWCSEGGIAPAEVAPEHIARFVQLVRETCLKQRADGAERRVARAWRAAQAAVPGWPAQILPVPAPRKAEAALPWSAYPPSLEADARAVVARGRTEEVVWLAERAADPLRPATRRNYLGALQRAAGDLVAAGVPPEQIRTLADLVHPDRVKTVLRCIRARTGRSSGSGLSQTAVVLLLAARDHVRLPEAQVAELAQIERRVRGKMEMGDRTFRRLAALDDPAHRRALLNLPARLMKAARAVGAVNITSARLARAALFLQLLLDSVARPGNIVGLDMARHLQRHDDGTLWIFIDAAEVKNRQEITVPLPRETVRLLDLYVKEYRPVHAGGSDSSHLFARKDGSHWPQTEANATLQDLTAKYIGVPVNPHLVRAVVAEILEESTPGALGLARDVLGHRSIRTTEAHYARRKAARSRRLHQQALDAARSRR